MKKKITSFTESFERFGCIKHIAVLLTVLIHSFTFGQTWMQLSNIGASVTGPSSSSPPVKEAVSLSLNGKIYVIGNQTFTGNITSAMIWEYTSSTDSWTEKSSYPGNGASFLCGFSIGNFIYVGCGGSGSTNINADFYRYNPASNTWTPISNIPAARANASAFSIGGKGYVTCGMGMGGDLNDLWEYDPTSDNWSQKTNFPGAGRFLASAFASAGFGFAGLGFSSASSTWNSDFYKYNPGSDTWAATTAFPGQGRSGAGVVVLGNQAIVICGNMGMTVFNDCYHYDVSYDSWSAFPSYGGVARSYVICGNIANKIFAGGGSGAGAIAPFNDWWTVETTVGIKRNTLEQGRTYIFRNAANETILRTQVKEIHGTKYTVYDQQGKAISFGIIAESDTKIRIESFGAYVIVFESDKISPIKFINY